MLRIGQPGSQPRHPTPCPPPQARSPAPQGQSGQLLGQIIAPCSWTRRPPCSQTRSLPAAHFPCGLAYKRERGQEMDLSETRNGASHGNGLCYREASLPRIHAHPLHFRHRHFHSKLFASANLQPQRRCPRAPHPTGAAFLRAPRPCRRWPPVVQVQDPARSMKAQRTPSFTVGTAGGWAGHSRTVQTAQAVGALGIVPRTGENTILEGCWKGKRMD